MFCLVFFDKSKIVLYNNAECAESYFISEHTSK